MGFSLGMVMNVAVLGACAVSFAMKMLRPNAPELEKKEILDEAAALGEHEELLNAPRELEEMNTYVEEIMGMLMDKETELQMIKEENQNLRSKVLIGSKKIARFEDSLVKMQDQLKEAYAKFEEASDTEKETLEKLRLVKLELKDIKERVAIALEQLETVKAAKLAMETKMEQNRIQIEKYKKTVDARATVLQATVENGESSGKLVERSASPNRKQDPMLRKVKSLFKKKNRV